MSKKHKTHIAFKTRLAYARTWLAHPIQLLPILVFTFILGFVATLASPCGRHSHAIHGVCSDGHSFSTPVDGLVLGLIVFLVLVLALMLTEPALNEESNGINWLSIIKRLLRPSKITPQWRRSWFWRIYPVMYAVAVIIIYLVNRGSGMYWYNYAVLYIVLGLMIAGFTTTWLLDYGRRLLHKHQDRS